MGPTLRLLRAFLRRPQVTSRLRCSFCPTLRGSGLLESHVNGDGRIPARCQLAAGVLPGEAAIGHFAHEAGKGHPAWRCQRWILFKEGWRAFAGWRVTPRVGFMEQTNTACFVRAATSGPVMYLHFVQCWGDFAGKGTSRRSDSARHSLIGAV